MKKRILSLLLVLLLLCVLVPQVAMLASADEPITGTCGADLKWSLDTETGVLSITGTGKMSNFNNDAPWRNYAGFITKVVLADTVTSIGGKAFADCTMLREIAIPDSVTSIGGSAFANCWSLTTLSIGKGVTTVGDAAFSGCTALKELTLNTQTVGNWFKESTVSKLTLGPDVQYLDDYAFSGCYALTSVDIPDSVLEIGDFAFLNCISLSRITVGKGVTKIGKEAFSGCNMLIRVDVKDLDKWCAISFNNSNPLTYAQNLYVDNKLVTALTISNAVTDISDEAFAGCTSITSLTISENVKTVGKQAFMNCGRLTTLKLGDDVETIGESAFAGCMSLQEIQFGAGLKEIGKAAFSGCTVLKQANLPDNLETVGESAFAGCSGMKSVKIPAKVTKLGKYAFSGCTGLLRVEIDDLAAWCQIEFETEKNSDEDTRANPLFYADSLCLNNGSGLYEAITDLKIPATVAKVSPYAFKGCAGLTSVTVTGSTKEIGKYAFCDCTGVASLTLASGVETIGDYAFFNCGALEKLAVPAGIKEIGKYAFGACTSMTEAKISGTALTALKEGVFSNCTKLAEFTVPTNVSTIGDSAFYGCGALEIVTIPNTVGNIGAAAFAGCSGLKHVCYGADKTSWQTVILGANNTELTRSSTFIHWNTTDFAAHRKTEFYQPATCTVAESYAYSCDCNYTWTVALKPAFGHDFLGGVCKVCGTKDPTYKPLPFKDVPLNAYYRGPVEWAVKNGITGGTSKTTFSPDKACTRAQVVTFLWTAMGKPAHTTTKSPFTDVTQKNYYYDAVLWALDNGITSGISPTRFGSNKACTRAQFVTFLWRAMGFPDPKTDPTDPSKNPFPTDVDPADPNTYYYKAVLWAKENGVTGGTGPTSFGPNKVCTRAQVVTFLYAARNMFKK